MTIRDFDPTTPHHVTTVLKRLAGPLMVARNGGDARQVTQAPKAGEPRATPVAEPPIGRG